MKFTFFTLGGRFLWEDVCCYQGWKIQCYTRNKKKYRLLDTYSIRRESGSFKQCKDTLLKYISAYELDGPYKDTILILPGFGRTKNSMQNMVDSFKGISANIIVMSYASLKQNLSFHTQMLAQLLQNSCQEQNLYIINYGAGCLLSRKMLNDSDNYRQYNVVRVLDINPMNSGSDLADLLKKYKIFNFLFGPMLRDIATPSAVKIGKLPADIEHGIIFCPSKLTLFIRKMLSRYESFSPATPPAETSYADNILNISHHTWFPLQNPLLFAHCRSFIERGNFTIDPLNRGLKNKTEKKHPKKI